MKDAETVRFGTAKCATCGHHPIFHLHPRTLEDGVARPCLGAAGCACMRYEPTAGDEPALIVGRRS